MLVVNQHVRLYAQAREEQPAGGSQVGDTPLFQYYKYYRLKPNIVTAACIHDIEGVKP